MVPRRPPSLLSTSADALAGTSPRDPIALTAAGRDVDRGDTDGRTFVPVGPGKAGVEPAAAGSAATEASGFPIQTAKIQSPPLHERTLQRDRLLDWLRAKMHQRAIFAVAEAGYGKTTLLADFARRTRARTLWYRLDEDDRDPIAFMNYLVATFRSAEPSFAPTTAALLRDLTERGVSHETLVGTFIRELSGIGTEGTVLIIDDFHLVDDNPEIRALMRRILERAPERLTVVLLTRRRPQLPVARLRALGELAELTTDDLRFRPDETERLFRESYLRPLEADVLAELARRTEGWAASLQLVGSALRDRSPSETRSFVRTLTGTHTELYDYLAEEVVGDLEPDLQDFLMRTALLQRVDPTLAAVITGLAEAEVRLTIDACERLGLLGRHGRSRWSHRYHPLVQGFLTDRLVRDVGPATVRELHRTVARYAIGRDWRLAAYHWAAAGDATELHDVLAASIPSIMGTGEFGLAESYLERFPPPDRAPAFEVFLSRLDFYRNRVSQAIDRARWAAEHVEPASLDAALANQMSLEFMGGDIPSATETATHLRARGTDPMYKTIAEGLLIGLQTSLDGSIEAAEKNLESLALVHAERGLDHFLGITLNNHVSLKIARGDALGAISLADQARQALERSSAGPELAGLQAMEALAYLQLGDAEAATRCFSLARDETHLLARAEVLIAEAEGEAWYGSGDRASALLTEAEPLVETPELQKQHLSCLTSVLVRMGRVAEARRAINSIDVSSMTGRPGEKARVLGLLARVSWAEGGAEAKQLTDAAVRLAGEQGAEFWRRYAEAQLVAHADASQINRGIVGFADDSSYLSMVADVFARRLGDLDGEAREVIEREARLRPRRWREALRLVLGDTDHPLVRIPAAKVLDQIGEREDVARLRAVARSLKARGDGQLLGKRLAKMLAPPTFIEDLGRVRIRVGERRISGADVRRKPLTLLVYLVSRPGFAATREQVLDALWPDLEPDDAQNSLNQTLYFLRRIFDPAFDEDTSPAYVRLESDLLWLDPDLVDSRSAICRGLARDLADNPSSSAVDQLVRNYLGRFALDFSYEDWATGYRGSLHAAYLESVEKAIQDDLASGRHGHALFLARAALEVDPEADQVELSLLRIYRATGAYAAAAEQYGHYASMLRQEYDEEPPALDSL